MGIAGFTTQQKRYARPGAEGQLADRQDIHKQRKRGRRDLASLRARVDTQRSTPSAGVLSHQEVARAAQDWKSITALPAGCAA